MIHPTVPEPINVLLLENIHADAARAFASEGFTVRRESRSLDGSDLVAALADVQVLGVRSKTNLPADVIRSAPRLAAIGAFCVGTNHIDLPAAQDHGVVVYNAPFSNTRSVVELAIGEIILLMRRVALRNVEMHDGRWQKSAEGSYEVRGKTLGIIGYGNIGAQLSVLAEAMGMEVIFYDRVERLALGNATPCTSMDELLAQADVVTVHVDGDPSNTDLIGRAQFARMKPGVVFLNLSRGFVVDHEAMAQAIRSGQVGGAAVDVFPSEPTANHETFVSALRGLGNVILTPHIGGSTLEAQQNIASSVSVNLINYLKTGNSTGSVNFPAITLPPIQDAHRLIHVHRNEPGVLAGINDVFAHHQINIVGQYLKTNERIGYVITDISKDYDAAVLRELEAIPQTIRFRALY